MTMLTHAALAVPGLCSEHLTALKALIGPGAFKPREAASAYLAAGYPWTNIPYAYAAMVRAGRLPNVGLVWDFARIAFREAGTIERLKGLALWAKTLGPDNWHEAKVAAYAAYAAAAYDAAYAAAAAAYDAAYDAAYAAYDAAYDAAYAAYDAAYAAADAAADAADAARNRVQNEIITIELD